MFDNFRIAKQQTLIWTLGFPSVADLGDMTIFVSKHDPLHFSHFSEIDVQKIWQMRRRWRRLDVDFVVLFAYGHEYSTHDHNV